MRLALHRLWFRLTTQSQCAWCGRVLRRAPLHRFFPKHTTHGICKVCCTQHLQGLLK